MVDVDALKDAIVSMAYADHVRVEQFIIQLLKSVFLYAIITQYGQKRLINVSVRQVTSTLVVSVLDAKIIKFLILQPNVVKMYAKAVSSGIF